MHLDSPHLPAETFRWRFGAGPTNVTVVAHAAFDLLPVRSAHSANQAIVGDRSLDAVPFKTRREVLIVGGAFAPRGKPAGEVVVRCAVGKIDKSVAVHCDRHAEETPIVGVGPLPRAGGSALLRKDAETVYDASFRADGFSIAPPDQRMDDAFADEPRLVLHNLHATFDRLSTTLPRIALGLRLTSASRDESHGLIADTIWIDAARLRCNVTYRVHVPVRADETDLRGVIWVEREGEEADGTATLSLSSESRARSAKATPFDGASAPPSSSARTGSPPPVHVSTGTRAMPAYEPPSPPSPPAIAAAPPIAPAPPPEKALILTSAGPSAALADARDASDRAAGVAGGLEQGARKRRRVPRELVPVEARRVELGELVHQTDDAIDAARTWTRAHAARPTEIAGLVLAGTTATRDELDRAAPGSVVLVAGTVRPAFATRDWIRAAVGHLRPLAATDPRVKEILEAASASVDDGWAAEPLLEATRARLREAYTATARRDARGASLDGMVEASLVERRLFLGTRVLGAPRVVLELSVEGSSKRPVVEAYAVEAARDHLPLLASFPARVLGVVRLRQREADSAPRCLEVAAIVRTAPVQLPLGSSS